MDTYKKIAIIGKSKFNLSTVESQYYLKNFDDQITDTFTINRITGGYNGKLYGKVFSLGKCFKEPSLKF